MRKTCITALLLTLTLLAGCAGTSPAAAPVEEPSPSPETWGVQDFAALSPGPAPTPAPTPEPTPEPTPTPEPLPASLTELVPDTVPVVIDGVLHEGLVLGEDILVDPIAVPSGTGFEADGTQGQFTSPDGQLTDVNFLQVDGREHLPSEYTGQGGILFQGDAAAEYWLPVDLLAEMCGMRMLWDSAWGTLYLTSWVDTETIPLGYDVPILMYHAVSDDMWGINELFVSPSDMEAQLQYLVDNGYDPIFFSDLPHLANYDKPVILTFDDGYDDNYNYLFPLLKQYDVKATCFIITGMLGDRYYMTAEQAREMSDSGLVDIQSHTVDHHELATLGWDDQVYQLSQSQLDIARITGKIPYVLSYPSGSRNGNTLEIAPEYYAFGIDMNGGTWRIEGGSDNYKVDRLYVSRYTTIGEFVNKVS